MDTFLNILKRSPYVYLIRKDFKMYLSDKDIEISQINYNSEHQSLQDDGIFQIEGPLLESMNFYLFQKTVNQSEALQVFQSIQKKLQKEANGIDPCLVEMKLNISSISPVVVENAKELHKKLIGSDDILLILSDQVKTDIIWKEESDYKIQLVSPFYIKKMHYIAYSKTQVNITMEKREDVCGDCGQRTNSCTIIDLAKENSSLSYLNIQMVIPLLSMHFDYENFCECCVSVRTFDYDNKDYVSPVKYSYSHILFEHITLNGGIWMPQNNNFSIEIVITQELKKVTTNDEILTYIKLVQEQNTNTKFYLNLLRVVTNSSVQGQLQKLQNEQISEIEIEPHRGFTFEEFAQILENSTQLIRITNELTRPSKDIKHDMALLINRFYSLRLSIINFNKLFNNEFSIFRILYDLYEQD